MLYHSIYKPNPFGHGGEKRSAQLQEYFAGKGDDVSSLGLDLKVAPKFSYIIKAFYWVLKIFGVRAWKKPYVFLRYVKHVAIWLPQLEKYFSQADVTTFYWESTRDTYYILPYIARKYNKKIVAFPHNLEALVPNQQSSLFRYDRELAFKRELEVLGICDEVYCIASEESWLLRLWGINASFLPYLPPCEMQKQLKTIKKKRDEVAQEYYLILGSAINPFGSWSIVELMVVMVVFMLILALIYKVKFTDMLSNFAQGAKKAIAPAVVILFIYTILVVTTYHGYQLVIDKAILGLTDGFNVFTTFIVAILSALFNVDASYAFQSSLPYLASIVTNTENYSLISVVYQAAYGFVMLIAPTSIILMGVLSYLKISFGKWFKAVWQLLLELLVVLLIIFTILVLI